MGRWAFGPLPGGFPLLASPWLVPLAHSLRDLAPASPLLASADPGCSFRAPSLAGAFPLLLAFPRACPHCSFVGRPRWLVSRPVRPVVLAFNLGLSASSPRIQLYGPVLVTCMSWSSLSWLAACRDRSSSGHDLVVVQPGCCLRVAVRCGGERAFALRFWGVARGSHGVDAVLAPSAGLLWLRKWRMRGLAAHAGVDVSQLPRAGLCAKSPCN